MDCLHCGKLLINMNSLLDKKTKVGGWVNKELGLVVEAMEGFLQNDCEAINELCKQVFKYKGKLLRPSLLLLSWRSVKNKITTVPHCVHVMAGVFELIHLATLVHDDVLDEAELRRGGQTINILQGNEAAVMFGDYLLSSAYHFCSTVEDPELNRFLGRVTTRVCVGEVSQLYSRNNIGLSVAEYYKIIKNKTGVLIGGCCSVGGTLGGANQEQRKALDVFGSNVGLAFQIRDDLLDLLCEEVEIGKPVGGDIQKGKMTLPLILLLKQNPGFKKVVKEAFNSGERGVLRDLVKSNEIDLCCFKEVDNLINLSVEGVKGCFDDRASEPLCLLANQLRHTVG